MTELETLRQDLDAIKARAVADTAFLRCAIFTLSTAQLRGTQQTLGRLAEDLNVKFMYRSESESTNAAVEARQRFWLEALTEEIAARDAIGRP